MHGPSLKNASIGAASFYKSLLDTALLGDTDGGLAHVKDAWKPFFVKGVDHVFLWRFLELFRAYKRPARVCTWIGRFEIAQGRLLAPWADLIGAQLHHHGTLTNDGDRGAAVEQLHHHGTLTNDGNRGAYQTLLREQSIHQHGFLPGGTQGGHQQVHLALVCLL